MTRRPYLASILRCTATATDTAVDAGVAWRAAALRSISQAGCGRLFLESLECGRLSLLVDRRHRDPGLATADADP